MSPQKARMTAPIAFLRVEDTQVLGFLFGLMWRKRTADMDLEPYARAVRPIIIAVYHDKCDRTKSGEKLEFAIFYKYLRAATAMWKRAHNSYLGLDERGARPTLPRFQR